MVQNMPWFGLREFNVSTLREFLSEGKEFLLAGPLLSESELDEEWLDTDQLCAGFCSGGLAEDEGFWALKGLLLVKPGDLMSLRKPPVSEGSALSDRLWV